jgi:hypothetical protein
VPGTRSVTSDSRSRIDSPHIGQSLAGIDFSLGDPYRTSSLMHGHTIRPLGGGLAGTIGHDIDHADASCFSDEVVVDFPSIVPAVERIRTAFLADDRPAPLGADLRLSARDAVEGTTLPVPVPVRCTCRGCGGRGESWMEPCARCAGSGTEVVRHQLHVTVPPGVADGTCVQFTVRAAHDLSTRIELRIAVG